MFASKKWFSYLAYFILSIGIIFRLLVFLQNRNLIIDEANVARNIVERGFFSLLLPLNYEQYAPPVFLWITKLNVLLFGTSEYAFRLYPLLCGFLGLILLYLLLKKIGSLSSAWYPLFLMATGWIYVRYGTEVKQYASDVVVTLGLLLLCFRWAINSVAPGAFFLRWLIVGSLSIWTSMPSVFMLAGIGTYYFIETLKHKHYQHLMALIGVSIVWLLQFYFYYEAILAPQAHSGFLQNSHKGSFLILLPGSAADWAYNAESLSSFFYSMGGKWAISVFPHLVLLVLGFIVVGRKKWSELVLFLVPLLGLLIAAGLHDFSLLPRVSLFMMPLLLLLIGIGLNRILQIKLLPIRIVFFVCCLITMWNFNELKHIENPMQFERITQSYDWIKGKNADATIWVHDLARPQHIYYTTLHPDSEKWKFMSKAQYFYWNTNMDSLARQINGKTFFIYSWLEEWDWKRSADVFPVYFTTIDSMVNETNKTYFFERK